MTNLLLTFKSFSNSKGWLPDEQMNIKYLTNFYKPEALLYFDLLGYYKLFGKIIQFAIYSVKTK